MNDPKAQKILSGNSIPIFTDNDEDSENVELDADIQYMSQSIVSSIGTVEFKSTFLSMLDRIRLVCTFEDQRNLCHYILDKIKEVYDYEPFTDFEIKDDDDVWQVYNLIAFLEYNHRKFLIDMWLLINPDLKNFDIEVECKLKEDNLLPYMNDVIERTSFSRMIVLYLRTNIKENLIKWFCNISLRNYAFIKLELLRRIENG
jgi:hypothetical protein